MAKLTLTRLEDRVVYDAAPVSIATPEPAEPPAAAEAAGGNDADPSPDAEGVPERPANTETAGEPTDSSALSFPGITAGNTPDLYLPHNRNAFLMPGEEGVVQPAGAAEPGSLPGQSIDNPGAAEPHGDDADQAESLMERRGTGISAGDRQSTRTGNGSDRLDYHEGGSVFDQYAIPGDFRTYMLAYIDLVRGSHQADGFRGINVPIQDFLIGGRLGVEPADGQQMRLYWLLDSGDRAYFFDCRIINGCRLQLVGLRNGEDRPVFQAATASQPDAPIDIPVGEFLGQLRFYSAPDDIGDDVGYLLNVNVKVDNNASFTNEGKYLNPVAPPEPIPEPPGDDPVIGDGPGSENSMDNPGGDFTSRPGDQDQQDDPQQGDAEEISDFDYGLMRNANIADLVRFEELPDGIRAEVEELSGLIGEIGESEVPAAADIAAGIVEMSRTYALFNRGVSRLVGMLAGLDGLNKTPAVAEWVADMAKRGEKLFCESSGQVSRLLRAVKEFRATEAGQRDSMAYAHIAAINAAMDSVNREARVLAAGLDRLLDCVLSSRHAGDAADVLILIPAVEEHMAAVARDLERLDNVRDTMFYVLRDAKIMNETPGG